MRLIEDAASSPSGGYKKNGKSVGNVYWLPADFKKLIEQRRLYSLEAQGGVAWINASGLRKQFCFLTSDGDIETFTRTCDVSDATYVSELIYNAEHPEQCISERVVLRKLGFSHYADEQIYSMQRKNLQLRKTLHSDCYAVCTAVLQDMSDIAEILSESLDPITKALPCDEDLRYYINHGICWKIVNNSNHQIAGCMFCEPTGHRVWIRHVVIQKKHQGLGLGKLLLESVLLPVQEDIECTLWVKTDNLAAIQLYQGLGFMKGNRCMEIWRNFS